MKSLFVWSRFLFPWLSRPTVSVAAAPVLFGALVLTGCGGGGDSATTPAVAPVTESVPRAATTAPAIPVKPQPLYESSGEGSYAHAVQNYNHIGEALHGQ